LLYVHSVESKAFKVGRKLERSYQPIFPPDACIIALVFHPGTIGACLKCLKFQVTCFHLKVAPLSCESQVLVKIRRHFFCLNTPATVRGTSGRERRSLVIHSSLELEARANAHPWASRLQAPSLTFSNCSGASTTMS
jgi:hypothetical protein